MNSSVRSILHPTDFSDLSGAALAHALRIALAAKSKLHLLHIAQHDLGAALAFPHVRRLLVQWGLTEETDPPWVVSANLGFEVDSTTIKWQDPAQGIIHFLHQHSSDLIVLGTHGREGIERWLKGSVSEAVFRRFAVPALFLTQGARGFVSQVNGDIRLRRVLIPIDFSPAPSNAIDTIERFCALLMGSDVAVHLIHIGSSAPPVQAKSANNPELPKVILRSGNIVKSIVDAAIEFDVDLIGMPTAGHHSALDALRGSTTERVIRHAPCAVFAVPIASSMSP
jgi:nucleotide-binding universal stress UspA family protein